MATDDTLGTLGNVAQIGLAAYGASRPQPQYGGRMFNELPKYNLSDFQGMDTEGQGQNAIRQINRNTANTARMATRAASRSGLGRSTAAAQVGNDIYASGANDISNALTNINTNSYNQQLQQLLAAQNRDVNLAEIQRRADEAAQGVKERNRAIQKQNWSSVPYIGQYASLFV